MTNGAVGMAYDVAGEGERAVVFIHGHPFNRSMWSAQMQVAAGMGWRALAPDLRGYGETPPTSGDAALATFAGDIVALLDEVGQRRAVFVGLSMGGQVAMEMVRSFPERVEALILAATFPRAEDEAGKRLRYDTADRIHAEGMQAYAEEVLPRMLSAHTIRNQPGIADQVLKMMRASSPAGAAAALRGRAVRPAYQDALAGATVPALIVVGEDDAFTTRADAEEMHALLRGSKLVWMEKTGHMPNLEQSEHFNTEMAAFLRAL
jgi:pimeloyl-ACP methyl ester carboxylesterase